jgi:hypothetical protein
MLDPTLADEGSATNLPPADGEFAKRVLITDVLRRCRRVEASAATDTEAAAEEAPTAAAAGGGKDGAIPRWNPMLLLRRCITCPTRTMTGEVFGPAVKGEEGGSGDGVS